MRAYCPWCMSPVKPGAELCPTCRKDPTAYVPSSHHFPPGQLLKDRYLVGRVLGEGGFGITYLGMDTNLERRVAIKEYFPTSFVKRETSVSLEVTCYTNVGRDFYEKGRDQFLQEARTMAKLEDIPEIVRVLDFFPANNTAYIVMEFLEGSTLKELVQEQGRIPAKSMLEMLDPVLRAMESMHRAGIIHRDISPDNLMVLKSGKIKLMDFGCARDIEGGRTMTVTLKHGFAPMEQYTGHGQGPWSDVYALCATVYYCLTGKVPPRSVERSDSEQDSLILPNKEGANLTPDQERALVKGLAVRAKNRWQSAASLYAALYGTTMDGFPWIPEETERKQEAEIKTEYVRRNETADSDAGETVHDHTEYAGPDDGQEREETLNHKSEAAEKKRSLAGMISSLPKGAKAGIAGAACLAVILTAVLTMGKQPAAGDDGAPASGTVTVPEDSGDGSSPEDTPEDSSAADAPGKIPGIEDPQPTDGTPAQGEDTSVQPTEPSGQTTRPDSTKDSRGTSGTGTTGSSKPDSSTSGTGTASSGTTGSSKPGSGTSGTSTASGGKTSAPADSGQSAAQTSSDPSKEELEQAAQAAADSRQYTQAADDYRQMKSLGYITNSQLADHLQSLARDAEDYWEETAFGHNDSPYIKTAFELYSEAANLGNTEAYAGIAFCYDYGHYVSVDKTKACEWWTKLANTGDGPSCYFVAEYYARGEGVAQDTQKAIEWLNKCFEYGASYVESDARALLDKLQGT